MDKIDLLKEVVTRLRDTADELGNYKKVRWGDGQNDRPNEKHSC